MSGCRRTTRWEARTAGSPRMPRHERIELASPPDRSGRHRLHRHRRTSRPSPSRSSRGYHLPRPGPCRRRRVLLNRLLPRPLVGNRLPRRDSGSRRARRAVTGWPLPAATAPTMNTWAGAGRPTPRRRSSLPLRLRHPPNRRAVATCPRTQTCPCRRLPSRMSPTSPTSRTKRTAGTKRTAAPTPVVSRSPSCWRGCRRRRREAVGAGAARIELVS